MGLFSSSPAKPYCKNAEFAYSKGQFKDALRILKVGFEQDATHKPLYAIACKCLLKLQENKEAALFESAIKEFKSAEPFFQLGAHFNRVNSFDLAIPFLDRALKLDANHTQAAMELSVAYASRFDVEKATASLRRVDWSGNFWTTYQMHYLQILKGDPSRAAQFIKATRAEFVKNTDDRFHEPLSYICMLEEALKRFSVVKRPEKDIQKWHFIQYGAAILEYYWDSEEYVAGGRYVALWGYPQSLVNIIEKLKRYLEICTPDVKKVVSLTDRDSEITGRAIANYLQLPFELFNGENHQDEVLLVAGDNRSFNDLDQLERIKQNQVLFALNMNWLERQRYCPDVCGHMSQEFYYYWDGDGLTFDSETQEMKKTPRDEREPEDIAFDLLDYGPEINLEDKRMLDFYREHEALIRGGKNCQGRRFNFTPESPVPGAYFH